MICMNSWIKTIFFSLQYKSNVFFWYYRCVSLSFFMKYKKKEENEKKNVKKFCRFYEK